MPTPPNKQKTILFLEVIFNNYLLSLLNSIKECYKLDDKTVVLLQEQLLKPNDIIVEVEEEENVLELSSPTS